VQARTSRCRARLSLGTSNDEAAWLFPIRKLTAEGKPHRETGSYGPHQGWTMFRGETKEEAASAHGTSDRDNHRFLKGFGRLL
jgi:hypothetical protein